MTTRCCTNCASSPGRLPPGDLPTALRLQRTPRFADRIDDRLVILLAKSESLHDIGKVGVPDRVLLKSGKLDTQVWAIMKTHAQLGVDARRPGAAPGRCRAAGQPKPAGGGARRWPHGDVGVGAAGQHPVVQQRGGRRWTTARCTTAFAAMSPSGWRWSKRRAPARPATAPPSRTRPWTLPSTRWTTAGSAPTRACARSPATTTRC